MVPQCFSNYWCGVPSLKLAFLVWVLIPPKRILFLHRKRAPLFAPFIYKKSFSLKRQQPWWFSPTTAVNNTKGAGPGVHKRWGATRGQTFCAMINNTPSVSFSSFSLLPASSLNFFANRRTKKTSGPWEPLLPSLQSHPHITYNNLKNNNTFLILLWRSTEHVFINKSLLTSKLN